MKIVIDYKMLSADVPTLVRLLYFHKFLIVYLLSPYYSNTETVFLLFWIKIEFLSDRMKQSA